MISFTIIGSSTPLQKILPLFELQNNAELTGVLLDANIDQKSIEWCEKHGIPWFSAKQINTPAVAKIIGASDWLLSVNSTVIIPKHILDLPKKGGLNLHPGRLPEYAGLHTHQWAIRNGETQFGVTVHFLEDGIDTGKIVGQTIFPISASDTGLSLFLKCLAEGTKLLSEIIATIINGQALQAIAQDFTKRTLYTHAMALNSKLNFKENTSTVINFIRAANYEPFQSPTYKPWMDYNGSLYQIIEAKKGTSTLNPGDIEIKEGRMHIGTNDGSVEIVKLKNSEGKKVSISALA